jgi:hypothetical protein
MTWIGDIKQNLTSGYATETRRIAANRKNFHNLTKAKKYLEETHSFQLFRGDQQFGKPKEMTGRAARDENKKYENAFYAKATQEGVRLWRLKWVSCISDPSYSPFSSGQRKKAAKAADTGLGKYREPSIVRGSWR